MRAFVLAAALALAPAAQAQTAFPADAGLLEIIRTRVESAHAGGVVLGVMEADGSTRIVAFGDPGADAKPLGPDSVFEIGSITKTFTATLLADMAQRGEVDPDKPAQAYAPPGLTMPVKLGPEGDKREITLAQLSEQNSGLPRLPGNLRPADITNPYADYTAANLYSFLADYQLTRAPGAAYEYSNLGVGLLGHVLSARAGMSYEALVRQRIAAPLGMADTAATLTDSMRANLARGHGADGRPAANWDMDALAGAGALRSSMRDMLVYLDANVGAPKNDLERAMRSAHQERAAAGSPAVAIGYGWHILKRPQGPITWHNGGTGGYRAFIGFDARREVGVVILANATASLDDIGFHLLDPSVPLAK